MKRSYSPELMDNFQINVINVKEALNELKIINKYLGGVRLTKSALKYFVTDSNTEMIVLDAGSGSSDILTGVKNNYPALHIFSLDKNLNALKSAENKINKINADIFHLPLHDNSVDIVHASLLLHHFNEIQICLLLKKFLRVSKKGIIINDLKRSVFALIGIKVLTVLFSKSYLVRNDAPLSVKKGFLKSELLSILAAAGFSDYKIKSKWAFRWMLVINK